MSDAPPPVFVDDTGRRRILTRRAGRIVVLGFTGYLGLVALGFARDPGVGPVHLPTFGLPSLGLVVPPAPVSGAQATRTAAEAQADPAGQAAAAKTQGEGPSTTSGAPAGSRATTLPAGPSTTGGPTASRAAAPNSGLPASNTSATTTPSTTSSTSSTTTSSSSTTTTTTTLPRPGQGQGQGQGQVQRSDAASTKGPTDSAPPGQQRKTTTTTAG